MERTGCGEAKARFWLNADRKRKDEAKYAGAIVGAKDFDRLAELSYEDWFQKQEKDLKEAVTQLELFP